MANKIKNLKLYCGDCLSVMDKISDNSIDCIICDLPYGITKIDWDSVIDLKELWKQYSRILKPNSNIILFSSGLFTYQLYQSNPKWYKYRLVWKKNVPTGMSSAKYRPMKYYEDIMVFQNGNKCTYNPIMKERIGKHKECYNYDHYCDPNNHINLDKKPKRYDPNKVQPSDILEFDVVPNRKGKLHPTQKPVELLEWLVKTYSNENDLVLDNAVGSGTTAIACARLNRNFIGIDISEKYIDITKERIYNEG